MDEEYISPFAVNAKKLGVMAFAKGGKHDDTTAVVSQIKFHYGDPAEDIDLVKEKAEQATNEHPAEEL
eukprot:CAMPEP_0176364754 /NCGR_PEP_ID=MMETSP0126-20121128/20002_1 /TAXON_ID=141414 ORGANISM="Strombidinopsis acuminatum, Strain SPMC142" /NCGR_SAMPLE_ID=MMETSP0126 /ASSEMBLY_ACC=CAM_ASM_000229 /LENGTH=67 /DNA_ID=CAMNT_0017721503 /DNA_START=720 /DNA_END=923 /DNA_ORIENTATION=-